VLIELREPRRALGPYGTTREVRQIGLSPDDLSGFRRALAFDTRDGEGGNCPQFLLAVSAGEYYYPSGYTDIVLL
jgi:hypothetical protein